MNDSITVMVTRPVQDGVIRDINTVTTEIKTLYQSAVQSELSYAVALGRKLTEAKELLEHGKWGAWVKENLPFSQDKANMMMQLYENYGASQESFFGEINSETFRNLGVSQAFALLQVPENEREEFVRDTHAEDMSVRELKKAIEERDALRKKAEALENDNTRLRQSNTDLNMKANSATALAKDITDLKSKNRTLEAEKKAALADAKAAEKSRSEAEKRLDAAVTAEQEARAALAEAKNCADIPPEKIKELERDVENRCRIASEARIEELEKKLRLAAAENNPDVAEFKFCFSALAEHVNKTKGALAKVTASDPDTAAKLGKALKAMLSAAADNL